MRSIAAITITGALAAASLSGCGSYVPPSASSAEGRASPPPTATAPTRAPWEGVGRAGPTSPKKIEATLRRHDLGRWIKGYLANTPLPEERLLSLTIENGERDPNGGQPEPIDYDAAYEINGNKVTFVHSEGVNTYRWKINQDILQLEYADAGSTMPAWTTRARDRIRRSPWPRTSAGTAGARHPERA